MKKLALLVLLALMLGCATDRPSEDPERGSSGPTVYGQLSVSVDNISVD